MDVFALLIICPSCSFRYRGVCFSLHLSFWLKLFLLFFSSLLCLRSQTQYPFLFQTSLNVSFSLLQLHLASTDHKIIVSVQTRLYPWFICLTLVLAREDPLSSLRLAAICIHSDVSGSLIARIFDNVFISFLHLTHPCSFPSHLLPHFFSIV
jgi:hypothetical protein